MYLYGLHILLQKNPPFRNTCGIHLSQLALRFLLPCGQMALTQLRRFTQGHRFGTNLRGQNFVTDRGPGPVFSHGWDRYTDFVDFIYHHVHASCLISEHPVEVVFIQVDFLGHRGFLFELKGSQSGVPPQHLDSSWFFGGSGRWFAQFVWAGKRQHLHFRPQTTWEILSKKSPWKFLGWGRANHFVATIWRCTTPPDYKMRCRPLLFCYKMAIENLPMILCCQFDFTNFATKWRWVRGTRPQYSFKKPLLQNDIWMMALHLHLPICIFRMPVCAKSICPPLATGEMASWSWKRS